MMHVLGQILFVLAASTGFALFAKRILAIRKNILLGKDVQITGESTKRWNNVLLLAFGQKKMFHKPLVGILHFFVYAGFIIINIELLEIILDGITGSHRILSGVLGSFYPVVINLFEVLALLVIVACAIFFVRRNILKLKRFTSKDLAGWPKSDANYILITEITLMVFFLVMNAADGALYLKNHTPYNEVNTAQFWVSSSLIPLLNNWQASGLVALELSCWWLHILGILAFMNYLPYSKHLHIILAFPNAYYARLAPAGTMVNMPAIQNEVLYAMQPELAPQEAAPPASFGAKDVFDLSWHNLLEAYACTECGRCSEACPANATGKALSPRKIMMDTRDRLEEVGKNIIKNGKFEDDSKTLLHQYITTEELQACTTCNACVEACPVSISPLEIIFELRRSLIMEESNAPQEWNGMFNNIENNFAPWQFSPDDRDKWTEEVLKA